MGELPSRMRRGAHRAPYEIGRTLAGAVAVAVVAGGAFYLVGPGGNDDNAQVSARAAAGSTHVTPSARAASARGETRSTKPTSKPSTRPTTMPTTKPSPSQAAAEKPVVTPTDTSTLGSTPSATSIPTRSHDDTPAMGRHAMVVVLNQSTIHGLAGSTGEKLRQRGWNVTGTGNFRGKVSASTVYYPPGMQAQAQTLASDLGVDRVRPRFGNLSTSKLTVVITG